MKPEHLLHRSSPETPLPARRQERAADALSARRLLRRLDGVLPGSPALRIVPGQRIAGRFYGAIITSALQALHAPCSGRVLAHEALARSYSAEGDGLSPWGLFAHAATETHLVALDRLCRTVHALNYRLSGHAATGRKLVLNVHTGLLQGVPDGHGAFFRQVLELIDLPPEAIVIDLPLLETADLHWLKRVVASYRKRGFGVAVTAASPVHAKLLAALIEPDWVRLQAGQISGRTVLALRTLGVRVVATCVETAEAHARCVEAGVDLAQGFHYGRPGDRF